MWNIKDERKQAIHRTANTALTGFVAVMGVLFVNVYFSPVLDRLSGVEEERRIQNEIVQLATDEGYRPCAYSDSKGYKTIGYGILMKDMEKQCIDGHEAINLLRKHYEIAKKSVEKCYPWAEGRKKLVLINLSYNMGEGRLAKFKKTLYHLRYDEFDKAAGELLNSNYAKDVKHRAGRLAARIMALGIEE